MEPIVSSETSAIRTQTPGNYPKRNKLHGSKLFINGAVALQKLTVEQMSGDTVPLQTLCGCKQYIFFSNLAKCSNLYWNRKITIFILTEGRDASQPAGEITLYWGSDPSLTCTTLLTVIHLINEVLCYVESTDCGFCDAKNHKMPVLYEKGNFGYPAAGHLLLFCVNQYYVCEM